MDNILTYTRCDDDNLYEIIGCDESSTKEQILAEYKACSLVFHPDKNPDDPEAAAKFQKIQKAKAILTDPEKRALYDKWNKSGFSMPFCQFLNMNKSCHMSIHWAAKKQTNLMIENSGLNESKHFSGTKVQKTPRNITWQQEPAHGLLRKFRDYEI